VAYQRTKTSIHTQNGISYDLLYDPTNAKVQIIQQNTPAGAKPIYEDGRFTAEATRIGLTDPNVQQTIHSETQSSVRNAYTSVGGASKGAQLPPWAQLSNQGSAPGQTSSLPASVPDPNNSSGNSNSSGNGLGTVSDAIEAVKSIANPADSIKNLSVNGENFGVGNESRLFATAMKYPEDMETKTQDHMIISQYKYTPPNAESIFSGAEDIWKTGLSRGSDFNKEQRIGDVFLPMPNTVQDSNSASWDADTMNNLSAGAASNVMNNLPAYAGIALGGGIAGGVMGGNPAGGAQAGVQAAGLAALLGSGALVDNPSLQALFGTDLTSKILNMQGRGVDAEAILARGGGIVPNNNMEFLFKGPTLRSFNNFSWRMSARSKEEAAIIRRIIRFFKQGMAPKKFTGKSGAPSYMLGTPNIFKLSYQNGGNGQIEGVNIFKTCALTQFATNYTPDGFWAAYDKGQPLSVTISMAFNELEPVYDTDYQDSIYEKRSDLTSVTDNMVGY
jgi:hypothetical protein